MSPMNQLFVQLLVRANNKWYKALHHWPILGGESTGFPAQARHGFPTQRERPKEFPCHNVFVILYRCMFNGQKCTINDFTRVVTDGGMCLLFNGPNKTMPNTTKSGTFCTLKPKPNGRHFEDDIFIWPFLYENCCNFAAIRSQLTIIQQWCRYMKQCMNICFVFILYIKWFPKSFIELLAPFY